MDPEGGFSWERRVNMAYKAELSIYLVGIPLIGIATGALSYAAYRLLGKPESEFVLLMMLSVWGITCFALGVHESIKSIRQRKAIKSFRKNNADNTK